MVDSLIPPVAFVSDRIGRSYVMGDANCWHLATETLASVFGITLPVFPKRAAVSRKTRVQAMDGFAGWRGWQETDAPSHGALVLMGRAGCERDVHAGVWFNLPFESGVLHTDAPHGVAFDSRTKLGLRGYTDLRFIVRAA